MNELFDVTESFNRALAKARESGAEGSEPVGFFQRQQPKGFGAELKRGARQAGFKLRSGVGGFTFGIFGGLVAAIGLIAYGVLKARAQGISRTQKSAVEESTEAA